MKVTNAMVMRAVQTLSAFKHPTGARAVRNALEAALQGVADNMPEMLALCEHKDARIDELEALVEQLRAELAATRP